MDIEYLVKNADDNFPLKQALLSGHRYYSDFLDTMLVFQNNLTKKEYESILKKFQFSKKYDMQRYLQTVSEITVLYYILRMYNNQFKYEPKYNNGYNPECSFEFGGKTINLEVKCPNMEKRIEAEQRETVKIFPAGRIPKHQEIISELKNMIEPNLRNNGFSGIEEIYRMDNKLKDFLISAQAKFPKSEDSNFNILAISLEIISDLDEWYTYIFGDNGVFTDQSFLKEKYTNVDAILLTTPVCGHTRWSCYDEINVWRLEETVNLLFLNLDRQTSETGRFYFGEGENLFGDMTNRFFSFQEKLDIQANKKWSSIPNYSWQDRYVEFKNTDLKIISAFLEDIVNQMENEYKKMVIADILQSPNTMEKVEKFKLYKDKISDCRIFLFDEKASNFDDSFKNRKIGQCAIVGIGDYTETWILDPKHISESNLIQTGKVIHFDLNILTYLNKILTGGKINIDEEEFLNYLSYLKKEKFQIGIVTALMERVSTPIDLCRLYEMIKSIVEFDNFDSNSLVNRDFENIYLSPDDYIRIKQIYDMTLGQKDTNLEQYNFLCCSIMKAYLIKTDDTISDKSKKVDKLIDYCLNVLNCYLEKEIVILSLYIMDDSRTHKTFKKLKSNSDIIKNILNVTWDIFHIRLIENIMYEDNKKSKDRAIFSYFGTADNGIIDAMQINPVKAFVMMNDYWGSVHQMNINDVCKNEELLEAGYRNADIRAKKIKEINIMKIRAQLEAEILERVKS